MVYLRMNQRHPQSRHTPHRRHTAAVKSRQKKVFFSTHGNAEGELHGPLLFLSSLSSHTRSAAPERDAEACWHALRAGMKGAAAEAATADA